jgi:hypothetical protein
MVVVLSSQGKINCEGMSLALMTSTNESGVARWVI